MAVVVVVVISGVVTGSVSMISDAEVGGSYPGSLTAGSRSSSSAKTINAAAGIITSAVKRQSIFFSLFCI